MTLSDSERDALALIVAPHLDMMGDVAIAEHLNQPMHVGPVDTADLHGVLLATFAWGEIEFNAERGPLTEADDAVTKLCKVVKSAVKDRKTLQMQIPGYASAVTEMLTRLKAAGITGAQEEAMLAALAANKMSDAERAIGREVTPEDIHTIRKG